MIDFCAENFKQNCNILMDGMIYADLPDIINWDEIKNNMQSVLSKMGAQGYDFYEYDNDHFIKNFKSILSPDYIRSPEVEAITFYAFKKDGSFREMQIPNLVHYCAFIYNSLYMFNEIFEVLYLEEENQEYVAHSNSYVVTGDSFIITTNYGNEEELEEGVFITKNNKNQERMSFQDNRRRYNDCQDAFLYCAKIDIESFFPNLYTHYLEKIINYEPYRSLGLDQKYFCFLDLFHQRINNNQTKGVPAGLFSSHIAAELLMLCVDYEISSKIKQKEMDYIRYVDDMVFFSDDKQELEAMVSEVQRILSKYRLRINGNKTEYHSNSVYIVERSDIVEIYTRLPFIKIESESKLSLNEENLCDFKEYITELLSQGRIVQIKAIMSLLLRRFHNCKKELTISEDGWFCYLFTLSFYNVNLVCHIYRLLDFLMDIAQGSLKNKYLSRLKKKTSLIEKKYCETLFQIWHYYLLTKYMTKNERMDLLEEYEKQDSINPIILCMFVESEEKGNLHLIHVIIDQMKKDSERGDWKQRIMFSQWWLPLMKVRMRDSYDYDKIYQSNCFPAVISDLIK